jgi:chromosome segregation ATPase
MERVYEARWPHRHSCQNGRVAADAAALLDHAAELERRDEELARELDTTRELAERAGAIRSRADDVRAGLERIPGELDELARRLHDAREEEAGARAEVELAEARLAGLEAARRKRTEEIARARSVVTTAEEALADARAQARRLEALEGELRAERRSLAAEGETLVQAAAKVADDLRAFERVTEGARREPGTTLDELEAWGGQVRSALFVARGTLETERERIVVEANALGSSVLGEPLGASSVTVVRRRLEERLR